MTGTHLHSREQAYLLARSCDVWREKSDACRAGLAYGETTITERLLLEMVRSYPGVAEVLPYTPRQEADTGADWLWCIQDSRGKAVRLFAMLVQAKRLDMSRDSYVHLDHVVGEGGTKRPQIDKLIETATRRGYVPAYLFYNHSSPKGAFDADLNPMLFKCPTVDTLRDQSLRGGQWGIAVAHAEAVRDRMNSAVVGKRPGRTALGRHLPISIPLHCLLCPSAVPDGSLRSVPEVVAMRMERLRMDPSVDERKGADEDAVGMFDEVPPVVALLRKLRRSDDATTRERVAAEVAERHPDLAGAVVLHSREKPDRLDPRR